MTRSRSLGAKPRCNPIKGELPVLQYCPVEQLEIDARYQRSLEAANSVTLVRRIATHWDWGLCQPLYVARRSAGALYVVDGQHRLAAARLRGDIWQLPCVVRSFSSTEEEAAAFVALNQERRPLSRLQIFKAALAAGDFEAAQIALAVEEAGLTIASSTNLDTVPAGAISNIGGLQTCYRVHGIQVLTASLRVLARSFEGQVLRYAGTVFPGIVAIVAAEIGRDSGFVDGEQFVLLTEMVGGAEQVQWYKDICAAIAEDPTATRKVVTERVFAAAWAECVEALLDEAA